MLQPTLEATPVSEVVLPEIQKDESASIPVTPVASQIHNEPVVTRRDLRSYYRVYLYIFLFLQYH